MPATKERPEEVRGIKLRSDFPTRLDSPDPADVIEACADHGTLVDAAKEVGCSKRTISRWRKKYPEVDEALDRGRDNLGLEAEKTLVEIMRQGVDPDTGEIVGEVHKDQYRATLKIAAVHHPTKDFSSRERREITHKDEEQKEQARQKRKIEELKDETDLNEKKRRFDELVNGSA